MKTLNLIIIFSGLIFILLVGVIFYPSISKIFEAKQVGVLPSEKNEMPSTGEKSELPSSGEQSEPPSTGEKGELPSTGPTIGALPSAYSITYNVVFPTERGIWKEYINGTKRKIMVELENGVTTIMYIFEKNYYSCTPIFNQWLCVEVKAPSYEVHSDPSKYLEKNPVFSGKKEIASRTANCYKFFDGTFCVDSATNILLELRIRTETGEFIMTATSLNLTPPSQEEFKLPAQPQQLPGYSK